MLVALLAWAAIAAARLVGNPCGTPPPLTGVVPSLAEVGACIVLFSLGGWVANLRLLAPERLPAAGTGSHRLRTAIVLQAGLVAFLLLAAVLLWYETFALDNFARYWPITFYVRCANHIAGVPTLGAAAALSFLFGHWFWPPAGRS